MVKKWDEIIEFDNFEKKEKESIKNDFIEEKKEKEKNNKNIYQYKDIYIIENWLINKINFKEIKDNDYILKYNKEDEFYIIDRDKRKIRPYVEDLLNQMSIETLQTKLIKASLIFIVVLIFINIISFFIWFSNWSKSSKTLDILNKVEKIQMQCDKPTLIPNNNKNEL